MFTKGKKSAQNKSKQICKIDMDKSVERKIRKFPGKTETPPLILSCVKDIEIPFEISTQKNSFLWDSNFNILRQKRAIHKNVEIKQF